MRVRVRVRVRVRARGRVRVRVSVDADQVAVTEDLLLAGVQRVPPHARVVPRLPQRLAFASSDEDRGAVGLDLVGRWWGDN